jgi:hypothetical protein
MMTSGIFSGFLNQETGRPFLYKGLIKGTSYYFGADSATKKTLMMAAGSETWGWVDQRCHCCF